MIRRLGTVALLFVALLLGSAQPVRAHATLVGTDPAQGAVLATAPNRILLTFDETVRGVPDGVQIFDARGELVEARTTVTGAALTVDLAGQLGTGTTVLTWRVVSDDGHPISGALTFSVGAATTPAVTTLTAGASTVPDVPWPLTAARWVGYTALLLAAGLVVFTAFLLPGTTGTGLPRRRPTNTPPAGTGLPRRCPADTPPAGTGLPRRRPTDTPPADLPPTAGSSSPRRRLTTALRAAAAVAVGAWVIAVPITAVYLLGGGPELLARGATWSSVPPTEYAVGAAVAVGLVAAVALLGRRRPVGAVLFAAIAATAPALTGHTRATNPAALAIGADVLHLLAGSVWLGGLAGLALTLPGLAGRDAAATLARFSTTAAAVLAALVATGALLTWRILGSWSALTGTGYGRLLLTKIAIAVIAVAIAAWNRWSLLPRIQKTTRRTEHTRPVVRAVTAEAAMLLAALLVTGFLVDTSPGTKTEPAATAADRGPRTTTLGDIQVQADLSPLTRGPNTVTLRMTSTTGEPAEGVAPPVVRLTSDRASLGAVPLTQVSPGFYTAQVTIPAPGIWRMQVSLRVTEFTNPVAELDFEVS
ncbi:copper resistance CopC/CopD family protein [Actinoplanes subglobosus]|uniref:Copper resistance protein CopC n=1 Tax=Actinoplanes subglobosus TaxID=1547892 RepID=A0ABV8J2Y3_9ACTN